jgi:HEPN domain-containing protein
MNFAKGLTLARLPHDSGFHNNLQTRLTLRESVPTHLELLQDAQDYLDRGEYRQAVIDSRTALEVYLDQTLEAVFQRDNWSHDKIKKALCLSQKWSSPSLDHIREALKAASINNKLKRGLRETLGVKLGEDGKLWYRWRKAKECREGSAHYGDYVSREVATKAVDTIREIMSRIYEATKDKYASGS